MKSWQWFEFWIQSKRNLESFSCGAWSIRFIEIARLTGYPNFIRYCAPPKKCCQRKCIKHHLAKEVCTMLPFHQKGEEKKAWLYFVFFLRFVVWTHLYLDHAIPGCHSHREASSWLGTTKFWNFIGAFKSFTQKLTFHCYWCGDALFLNRIHAYCIKACEAHNIFVNLDLQVLSM